MGTLQQIGGKVNATREVELNTLAARTVLRPLDPGSKGAYSMSIATSPVSGNTTNAYFNTVTNIPWAGLQWASSTNLMAIKAISVSMDSNLVGAGILAMQVYKASGYVRQFDTVFPDSAGALWVTIGQTITLGHGNKLRNTLLPSDLSEPVGADPLSVAANASGATFTGTNTPGGSFTTFLNLTTATLATASTIAGLPGGVFTLEAIPICAGVWSTNSPIGRERVGQQSLFDAESYGHPIVLENSTGLIFKATWPSTNIGGATLTYNSSITIQWDEIPVY